MKKHGKTEMSKLKIRRLESVPIPDVEILAVVVGADDPPDTTGTGTSTTNCYGTIRPPE